MWGVGCRVQGVGCRVWSSAINNNKVQGSRVSRVLGFRVQDGRGQPLSIGEIPWFDDRGKQRCDWLENTHTLRYQTGLTQKCKFLANHSAVFPPDHQTKEFQQMTVRATVVDRSHQELKIEG